jgi:predicted RNA-binding protein with PUA-like domain
MAKWLFKSEPDAFSWDDLVRKGVEEWTGVRSYQARNNMREMKKGDEGFYYHSNIGKEIVGICRVANEIHPDSTGELKNGKVVWECVDLEAVKPFKTPVTLDTIKQTEGLEQMVLVNNSRLSVQPVTEEEWKQICKMGGL